MRASPSTPEAVVNHVASPLLGTEGAFSLCEGWERSLATFIGEALLEDAAGMKRLVKGLAAMATALSQRREGRAAAEQLATFAADLARRYRAHMEQASTWETRREGWEE
jgi:environmental stress-induced protein Ves